MLSKEKFKIKMSVEKENPEEENMYSEGDIQAENKQVVEENVNSEDSSEVKYNELNDRFLRLYAEFDNYRRRTAKERLDLISSASSGVLKDIITILDDFDRAIANNKNIQEADILKEGFELIYTKLSGILEGKGLVPMNSLNQTFDSELHDAIANVPVENDDQKGTVIDEVEKGYYLNEKVIRFAKVVVGK